MASNKRSTSTNSSQSNKKAKNDAPDSQFDQSAFELELAMFEDDMDVQVSQESEGL